MLTSREWAIYGIGIFILALSVVSITMILRHEMSETGAWVALLLFLGGCCASAILSSDDD